MKTFRFIDLFCGGGGSITGEVMALREAGLPFEGRCFDFWKTAIDTVRTNYPELVPDVKRACVPVETVEPSSIFKDDRVDVIWASPSCTHHSPAAGGNIRSDKLRNQPNTLIRFLYATRCRRLYIENVPRLRKWGPLLEVDTKIDGRIHRAGTPDPRRAGESFNSFIKNIVEAGYNVDMQIMNAADYGAATSRKRIIIQAVRRSAGEKICWPEPTHSKEINLFGTKAWRSAAEVVDVTKQGEKISEKKISISAKTIRRIEYGKKFFGTKAPFILIERGTSERMLKLSPSSLDNPLPTITTHNCMALVTPSEKTSESRFRMLTKNELADATGFPSDYYFAGNNTTAKKMIGNAVCPCITAALYRAFLTA